MPATKLRVAQFISTANSLSEEEALNPYKWNFMLNVCVYIYVHVHMYECFCRQFYMGYCASG